MKAIALQIIPGQNRLKSAIVQKLTPLVKKLAV
jgi:hypothetical protein